MFPNIFSLAIYDSTYNGHFHLVLFKCINHSVRTRMYGILVNTIKSNITIILYLNFKNNITVFIEYYVAKNVHTL